ncbi:MAG: GuaB3 family IMP dehydrogenase-related protein [Elusimicrobia bacterium CG06_land_8_20_14_3_00_38_11]|nr:MAG: GuaB3 family IMP dehydrogenase-related protein [Elusimicrobia bacterium CG06_land_8_20_14_3_00_38_11]
MFFIGTDRQAKRAYGFDEIALVPSSVTVDIDDVDVSTRIGPVELKIPFLASAMDGVVDVKFSIALGKLGGLAVLNLDGVQTRYENPGEVIEKIRNVCRKKQKSSTEIIQKIYKEPVKEKLISQRITEIKKGGIRAAVSTIPKNAERYSKIAEEAGCNVFVIQSTVTTAKFISSKQEKVDLNKICSQLKMPVIIGNTVSYQGALELMETGCWGVLVGIGPGAACTTRGVLGIGVPQVTAIVDCAAARDLYFSKTKRYVSIIADGGMITGGDICKAFACGSDAAMIGSGFARAEESPGCGFHWGMATSHKNLPRGTGIYVGRSGKLKDILFGPAKTDDGTQNLVGALATSMGSLGAKNIKEMQKVEIIIAPEIKHEGKIMQKRQGVGMGK